jgi:hypothetical protein
MLRVTDFAAPQPVIPENNDMTSNSSVENKAVFFTFFLL